MDGQSDRYMDEQTDLQMYGKQIDRQTDEQKDRQMDVQTN